MTELNLKNSIARRKDGEPKVDPNGFPLICGKVIFHLKTTHGIPLDMVIDLVINIQEKAIDWVGFIQEARHNGWWDFQTHKQILHALKSADVPQHIQAGIERGFIRWVLANEHPAMLGFDQQASASQPTPAT